MILTLPPPNSSVQVQGSKATKTVTFTFNMPDGSKRSLTKVVTKDLS